MNIGIQGAAWNLTLRNSIIEFISMEFIAVWYEHNGIIYSSIESIALSNLSV